MPHLVIIDGYIGAGKSTLIEQLSSRLKIAIVPEYIEEPDGVELLNQYLNDRSTYAYSFQLYILNYYYKYMSSEAFKKEASNADYIIIERNPLRGITYFAKMDLLLGCITVEQYNDLYTRALNLLDYIKDRYTMHDLVTSYNTTDMTVAQLTDAVLKIIDYVGEVQLIADPDCIKERIKKRGRDGEVDTYDDTYVTYMCTHYFI